MAKYLDINGVTTVWNKVKSKISVVSDRLDNFDSTKANATDLSNVLAEEVIDAPLLEEVNTLTRETIKKDLFIDMWNQACGTYGRYNAETGYFELNGLTDITYKEALVIYRFGDYNYIKLVSSAPSYIMARQLPFTKIRTTIPFVYEDGVSYPLLGWYPNRLEVLKLAVNNESGSGWAAPRFLLTKGMPLYSQSLRIIDDILIPDKSLVIGTANQGYNQILETLWIDSLKYNITVHSPLLSLESFQYMIANATNTSEITITVHPDVYAKLTDVNNAEWYQVLTDATAKQIIFATV